MAADRTAVRIFDLVDAHKIGQAAGALETALIKFPDNDSLRAAEALVLLRQEQPERAKACALALSSKSISEPKAVNALVHVLQQCCCWEQLAATYERLRATQNDKQIGENLLQTYVRMGDYAKAQQVATQMYRAHASPKYQVWMVQACLGQVPADSNDHLMLKLATKLLDASVLTEKGVVSPATVRTYVDVLAQQGLYAEAVSFLCSERGAKIGLLETRLEVLARLLAKQGRLSLANAAARRLWSMQPDNWTPFEIYRDTITGDEIEEDVHATLELAAAQEELRATVSGSDSDHTLEAALVLARTLQEAQKNAKRQLRGPFLAELALLQRKGDAVGLEAAVFAYVKRFYRNPSCFLDVSTFLSKGSSALVYNWAMQATVEQELPESASNSERVAVHTRRIIGLRCHVAAWGATPDTMPSPDEMKALMSECVSSYVAAVPLSASVSWNEEGLCDAYIDVAFNIGLRAYCAFGKDLAWVVAAVAPMQTVDRRMKNSGWLLCCACFTSLLGLTDIAAHRQLAFKSVQHDTMSHLGYWPLVRGLALEDISTWEELAVDYYGRVERDCSLLRAKVFTFMSWPAMQDVKRFQAKQEHSVTRWLATPHACAALLSKCQTQKDIFELFAARGPALWQAWEVLGRTDAAQALVDNTDWTVARSVVLGDIHSETVRSLTDALVGMPCMNARLARARQLLCSLLLLADVAAVERQQQAARNAPKPPKGGKSAASQKTKEDASTIELYTLKLTEGGAKPEQLTCLPAVTPLAATLLPFLTAAAAGDADKKGGSAEAANEALGAHLDKVLASPTAEMFETFLYPEAYILAALVRVVPLSKAPAAAWAATLRIALEAAIQKYDGEWNFSAGNAEVAKAVHENTFLRKLSEEKSVRVKTYVTDLLVDVAASARRK